MKKSHKTIAIPTRKRKLKSRPKIAIIAHDAKKADMIAFAQGNIDILKKCDLIATGSTGQMLNKKTEFEVKEMQSGPLGGDLQIGGLVASEEIDLVIFLRDPLAAQPHDPDISALLRVCDVHNIPLATNLSSAEILLRGLKI